MEKSLPVEILDKYINGDCNNEEIAIVREWYASFEHDKDYTAGLDLATEKELKDRIYQHIITSINTLDDALPKNNRVRYFIKKWYAITGAAAAIVLIGIGILLDSNRQLQHLAVVAPTIPKTETISNNSGKIYKAILPDNSVVWMSPYATLKFPKVFAPESRMIAMTGQCFFEVTKNPHRPFIITSRSIITKVWGTSFLVRDGFGNKSVAVSVVTGKVSVSVKTNEAISTLINKNEIILYPHQKAVYLVDRHILKPENISFEPEVQIYNHINLSFENKPLRDIIPVLNAKYHIQITVANEKVNHYVLNADFAGFNLPDVLEALKKSLNVNYTIKNNVIELE